MGTNSDVEGKSVSPQPLKLLQCCNLCEYGQISLHKTPVQHRNSVVFFLFKGQDWDIWPFLHLKNKSLNPQHWKMISPAGNEKCLFYLCVESRTNCPEKLELVSKANVPSVSHTHWRAQKLHRHKRSVHFIVTLWRKMQCIPCCFFHSVLDSLKHARPHEAALSWPHNGLLPFKRLISHAHTLS